MSGSRGRSFLVLCPRRASTQSSRRRGVVVGVSFSTPSTSARSSPRPLPLLGEGRGGVGLFFSSPWRGKCRVFEAMGVLWRRASTPSTSARSSPRPLPLRGEGKRPHPPRCARVLPLRGEGRGGVGLFFSSPWRGKCRVFEAMGVRRARWGCGRAGRVSTPSTSAKAPRPLPLRGEGRGGVVPRLGHFPCEGKQGSRG